MSTQHIRYPASSGGLSTVAAGSTPNANGGVISGSTLTLEPADGSNPGIITTGAQHFAGDKHFDTSVSSSGGFSATAGTTGASQGVQFSGSTTSIVGGGAGGIVKLTDNSGSMYAQADSTGLTLGAAAGPRIITGTGSPASAVSAPVGSLYLRSDGGAGSTFYVKESGTGTSGWVAK